MRWLERPWALQLTAGAMGAAVGVVFGFMCAALGVPSWEEILAMLVMGLAIGNGSEIRKPTEGD